MDCQQLHVVFFVVFSHEGVLSVFYQLDGDILAQNFVRVGEVDSQITVAHVVVQYPQQAFGCVRVDILKILNVKSVAENVFEERFGKVDFEQPVFFEGFSDQNAKLVKVK